jgi:hypothetical protein
MKSHPPRGWFRALRKTICRGKRYLDVEPLEARELPAATWTPLTNLLPASTGTMLLQTDGTVMVQGGGVSNLWYKLTPDSTGSYVNAAWSPLASMAIKRLYGGSVVLPSGKVLFVGGEYSGTSGSQNETNTGELYDPQTNVWSPIAPFPQGNFGDAPLEVLSDGTVLAGYLGGPDTYLYHPATNTWTATGTKLRGDSTAEETWIKLPDGSILSYDISASNGSGVPRAQRYLPWTNSWVDAGTVPVPLSLSSNDEIGPAGLLPDGRVFQVGDTNQTALYTPATNTWAAGPSLPAGMGADDAPGAVLPNGHFLFAAEHPSFSGPTVLFDFDPVAGTLTPVSVPAALSATLSSTPSYPLCMLVVPSGEVLLTTGGSQIWDYNPGATPPASWQPTVSTVTFNGGQTYTLTGTQLNGISEGASYGDDAQMATNYPIIELQSGNTVTFARTFNWISQVATGNALVSTQFTVPTSLTPGTYSLTVIANGIASAPFPFATPLGVASSYPADGSSVSASPIAYALTFSSPINPASLQAGDLIVNGLPASTVSLDGSNTIATFTFASSPVTVQGPVKMSFAAGLVSELGNASQTNTAFSATFSYDVLPLAITSTTPAAGSTLLLPAPSFTYDLAFNEPIDPSLVNVGNLILGQGTVSAASVQPGNQVVVYTLTGLTAEGTLYVTVNSGTFRDQYDNLASPSLSASYFLDNGSPGLPTPLGKAPSGSLIYGTSASSVLLFAGDTDQFTLAADPGQTLSVQVIPTSPGLTPTVQLADPSGKVLSSAAASGPGQIALLQTVPSTNSGVYALSVGSLDNTTGNYTLQVTLDAAAEVEGSNATLASAQNLDSSFLSLGGLGGLASRGAAVGQVPPGHSDYFALTLAAGDTTSLGLESLSSGTLSLTLESASGAVLATGSGGAGTVDQLIANYVAPAAGTYVLMVTGNPAVSNAATRYTLVVTRNAALDAKTNAAFSTAQDVTGSAAVLGAAGVSGADWYKFTVGSTQTSVLLQTSTPLGGPSQPLNLLNPNIQLYNSSNVLLATGSLLPDGRNQTLLATGLTPGATYFFSVASANGSPGEYVVQMVSAVAITTPSLPGVSAGTTYRQSILASGGTGSLTFSATGSLPTGLTLSSSGVLAGTPTVAGSYSFQVKATDTIGVSATQSYAITITPGPAVRLRFPISPASTPTGVVLPSIQVQIVDAYGNVVTSDNTDRVSLGIASGPGLFLAGSSTRALVHSGIATFSNLTLVAPGAYTLRAAMSVLNAGFYSPSFNVLPLQVVPASFAGTPSGFSLQFNAPYLVNALTPVLYGQGIGAAAPARSVIVTTDPGNLSDTAAYMDGSLVLDPANKRITFVATNTTLEASTGSPLLPDGTYTVIMRSSAATDGFQALNAGGGFLDGLSSGTPGSGDFTASFVVSAGALREDAVWVPDVAEGPGQLLNAPGMNQAGGGYPIYLADGNGVAGVQVTLNYNPNLLQVTGATGANFTLSPFSTPGHAVLIYSGPALASTPGTPVTIGYLTAQVPGGTTANPMPYRARDLLTLTNITLSGGGHTPVPSTTALHLVAYVGDADGNGAYSSGDAVLITHVALQSDSGFAAYPLVDPIIVADTDGSGFIPADASLQVNEAGVGFPTTSLPSPPIPPGVVFQISSTGVAPSAPSSTPALALPSSTGTGPQPARRAAGPSPSRARQAVNPVVLDRYFARLADSPVV